MNDLSDCLRRERERAVPPHLALEVEQQVMRGIGGKTPGWRSRRRTLLLATVTGILTIVLAVVILRYGRGLPPPPAPQFTESVILLDDHVCIWLEPVEVAP
jgi:hypothetical protein